jgi:cytochrome P450
MAHGCATAFLSIGLLLGCSLLAIRQAFAMIPLMSSSSFSFGFHPPRPIPLPKALGPIALIKTLRRNPIESFTKAHFEEPIVMGGFPFARVALVSDPPAIRKVLVEDSKGYRKSALERRILSPRLREGLASVEGDQWASQRRTLEPLLSRKALLQFAPAMAAAAAALVARWRNCGEAPIEIKTEMSALASDVLLRSVFHEGLGPDPDAMRSAMLAFFASTGRIDPFDIIGLPDFVPRLTHWSGRAKLRAFDEAFDSAVAERRRSLGKQCADSPRDVLGLLLSATDPETGRTMSEAEVKANVLVFFFAGQETTSTAMSWAIYLLSQSPEWRDRVRVEADRELGGPLEGLPERLVETRAVLDEAMRLYPPVVGITRTATRRDELAGKTIERGTMVVVSPYVLHRHKLLWDDPDLFDPRRFLERAARKVDRYAYLPFGIGPRMCIGAGLALQEATLMLATVMKNFTLALVPGQSVWPLQRFTLRPRDPLLMSIKPRA